MLNKGVVPQTKSAQAIQPGRNKKITNYHFHASLSLRLVAHAQPLPRSQLEYLKAKPKRVTPHKTSESSLHLPGTTPNQDKSQAAAAHTHCATTSHASPRTQITFTEITVATCASARSISTVDSASAFPAFTRLRRGAPVAAPRPNAAVAPSAAGTSAGAETSEKATLGNKSGDDAIGAGPPGSETVAA